MIVEHHDKYNFSSILSKTSIETGRKRELPISAPFVSAGFKFSVDPIKAEVREVSLDWLFKR